MMKYKLTIVVPLYNVASYIKACIDSVLSQQTTFGIEVIMVDDGSTDRSLAIAKACAEQYPHIKVISQENKGLGGARNTGLLNASGEYILFLDADDRLSENALSELIKTAEEQQADILEFSAMGIDEKGNKVYLVSNKTKSTMKGTAYYNTVRYMNSACNKLYRLGFLKQHELFFRERIFIEDFEFNTRAFAKAERVAATDILGALFLQTPQSITRNSDPSKILKMQEDIIEVIRITLGEFQKHEGKESDLFFRERLSYLTVTLFYQLFKRKASYHEIKQLKDELAAEHLFFPHFPVHDKKKELFRRVVLKNLYVYPLLLKLNR